MSAKVGVKMAGTKKLGWMRNFMIPLFVALIADQALAAVNGGQGSAKDCAQLIHQLQGMQRAQGLLLSSMAKKNDSLAGTLDHFADDLSSHEQKPTQSDIVGLRKSAQAFRGHSDREIALIDKFQKKSKELIDKTTRCLAHNETPSNLRESSELHLVR
jgi:hypothetical protein